jgi:hypothetical protein
MPRPARMVALAVMALGAGAFAQDAAPNPRAPWRFAEIARAECRGGAFFGASIAADSTRMLTIGEGGVAIEWDLVHARERKRFAALDGATEVYIHPNDPWAIVVTGGYSRRAHRLDFGSGRYTELWAEPVNALAFDATGARAAVLFSHPGPGSRLAVFPEAALRAALPLAPDFVHTVPDGWRARVFFHPCDDAVFAGSCEQVRYVPFRGGEPIAASNALFGVLADGTEILETRNCYHPIAAGPHWLAGDRELRRGGVAPADWTVESPYGTNALANDGTVVAPDARGHLHLLGPARDRRRALRGQPGQALQLCFDASSRHLAIVGGCVLSLLDVVNGTTTCVDGGFTVQASDKPGEFVGLDGRTLATIRSAGHWRCTPVATLPPNATATTFERYWYGESVVRPFRWSPQRRQLWLGDVAGLQRDSQPACLVAEQFLDLALPFAADEYSGQRGIALGAGRDGDTVLATTKPPTRCGGDRCTWFSTLRTFDGAGHLRRSRPLVNKLDWMRTSPAGDVIAVPAPENHVSIYATDDLHLIHDLDLDLDVGPIVAWEFVDERTALASNGVTLLHVRIAAGAAKAIPIALPGPITRLCLSPDRRLVAIACGSDVRVLRRQ